MPRTSIAVQTVPKYTGLSSITFGAADAANGMAFPNDGRTLLLVRNADASTKTVTVVSVPDQYRRSGDITLTVPVTTGMSTPGFLDPGLFNQSDGSVNVNFSAATSVTVAAVRFEP